MFRIPARTLRTFGSSLKRAPIGVRFSSIQTSTSSNARYVWSSAAVIGTGTGFYLLSGKGTAESSTNEVPSLKEFSSEDQIPINSSVKELTMEDADAKLREDAHTFVFDGNGGVKGRVDFVRLGSNNPIEDEWDLKIANGVGGTNTLYAGVYDGHAGWATSKVLRAALVPYVSNALSSITPTSSNELVDDAIKKAFVRLDDRIFSNAQEAVESGQDQGSAPVIVAVAPAIAGSCALLTMYEPKTSTLRTAVAGDSRAVRGMWSPNTSKYAVDVLSKDQTGFNQDEVERLDKEHPGEIKDMINPASGRLFGMAITRAFGDHRWKWPEELIRKVKDDFYGTSPRDTECQSVIYRQMTLVRRRGRGRAPKSQSVEEPTKFQPGTLQFINSAHPDEITNANSIRLIRSHAAKLSRALQKDKKQGQALEEYDPESSAEAELRSLIHQESDTRYRKIMPKSKVHELTGNRPPSPLQLIGGARSVAYTGFARPLSDDEHYLFDFYLNYVISYGYTACYAQDDERNFSYLMRHIWVPNAMSKLSLMAAVFHVACRNYAAATNNDLSSKFAVKKLQYRLTCIQMAKDAIESEAVATDTTIALAMLMASEAFLEGDMCAYWSHGAGVMKMVRARGGVDMLGMSGFLTRTVSESIYLTRTNMIAGPDVLYPKIIAS